MAIPKVSVQEMEEFIKNNDKYHVHIKNEERDGLDKLRSAIQDIKGLRCPLSDSFLIRFLRTKNYDVPKSAKLVHNYFKLKQDEDHLQLIPASSYKEIYDTEIISVLKNRDDKNRQILYIRIDRLDLQRITMDEMLMAGYFLMEEMTISEVTQKNGIVIILDHANLTMSKAALLASNLSLKQINKALKVFQGSFPAKIKGIFCINVNFILNSAYSLIKYFLSEKLQQRVFFTRSGPEIIHNYVNREILPKILGGPLTSEEAIDVDLTDAVINSEKYHRGMQQNYGYVSKKIEK